MAERTLTEAERNEEWFQQAMNDALSQRSAADITLWTQHLNDLDRLTMTDAGPDAAERFFNELENQRGINTESLKLTMNCPCLLKVADKLDTASLASQTGMKWEKLLLANTTREYPNKPVGICVYLASGIDAELPILMGGNDIHLVDPVLASKEAMAAMLKKIEEYANILEHNETTLRIQIDGYGVIKITCFPITIENYHPQEPIQHLFTFNRPPLKKPIFTYPSIRSQLQESTIITDNRMNAIKDFKQLDHYLANNNLVPFESIPNTWQLIKK